MWSFDIFKNWGFPEQDKFKQNIGYTQSGGAGDISGEAASFDQYGRTTTSGIIQGRRQKKGYKKGVMENVNMAPNPSYGKAGLTNINALQKQGTTPFHPSQGGTNQNLAQDPKWWQKLGGMANVDMDKAMAHWKGKGGFEGLMANPAFTMGLAFMQAGAEGKTLGQGSLDNVMKAAGISSHYKKIIEDRKQAPIQATSQDVAEVKSLLETMNIEDPSWFEKAVGTFKGENRQAMFDMAAEDIANALEIEMRALQKANKTSTPLVFDTRRKIKILKRLQREGKIKKVGGGLFTAGTLRTDQPIRTRARGGPIKAGKSYVVGEQGPEIVIPKESGKVLSNDNSRIYAMLLAANPQLQKVSRARSERILRSRFPEYFE